MSKPLTFEDLVPSAPNGRFAGIRRPYSPEDVVRLRGSFPISYTLAERGANKLWELLNNRPHVHALGAVTGNQAMQMVRGGWRRSILRLASRGDAMSLAPCIPINRSIRPIPPRTRAGSIAPSSAPTRLKMPGKVARFVHPDRRRCRGRIRRPAQCLRNHESLYRSRRGRRPLRGPARFGKEVRPSRR